MRAIEKVIKAWREGDAVQYRSAGKLEWRTPSPGMRLSFTKGNEYRREGFNEVVRGLDGLVPETGLERGEAVPVPSPNPVYGTKDTNPKDHIGNRKLQLGLIPFVAQAEEALALTDGKYKYGAHNWTVAGVRASIYIDAALRHIARFNAGEDRDPESGVHNLGHARACLAILLDATARDKLTDDRPPSLEGVADTQRFANAITTELIDRHSAKHNPTHYSKGDS